MLLHLAALLATSAPLPGMPDLEFRRVGTADLRTILHPLLRSSYVATPDAELRLDYEAQDLSWMLDAPGANEELRIGIGRRGARDLIGFVCAAPSDLLFRGTLTARSTRTQP